jgi:hypothetical protein
MTDNAPANINDRLKEAISHIFNFKEKKLVNMVNTLQLEKRESDRKKHFAEVCYADGDRSADGFIQDISSGGLSIEPDGPFTKGQVITLTFMHPSGEDFIKITGKIVRKDKRGLGVQFSKQIENIIKDDTNCDASLGVKD